MVRVAKESVGLNLAEITRREIDMYAGESHQVDLYAVLDKEHQCYAVIVVGEVEGKRSVDVMMMARVVSNDYIIIEEDVTLDKPLVDALMVNGGVPRDKIILAYRGETLPTTE